MKKLIALAVVILVIGGCSPSGLIYFEPLDIKSGIISFTVQNKSAKPISLIWDESAFINAAGHSMKIVPGNVRIMDRNSAQPPAMIAPGTSLSTEVIPSENVTYDDGQWTTAPLCKSGEIVGLYLMVKIGDTRKPQKFTFGGPSPNEVQAENGALALPNEDQAKEMTEQKLKELTNKIYDEYDAFRKKEDEALKKEFTGNGNPP